MFRRLILLNSFLLLISVAPLWAQYSFEKVIGGKDSDRPYGMKQARDGYFYLYGQSSMFSPFNNGQNYVAKLDQFGNIIWQRAFTETSFADYLTGMVELPDGLLFFGGLSQEQLQEGNARVTIIKPDGTIILDTLHPLPKTSFGCIQVMVDNPDKGFIASIGLGSPDNNDGLMFQKTNYSGKRLWYKYLPYPNTFYRTKKMFKRKDKDEYIVFGEQELLWMDSAGNMLDSVQLAVGPRESFTLHDINDIVQNENGSFTILVARQSDSLAGQYLQHNDEYGRFVGYGNKLPTGGFSVLTKTKDKGYFAAGKYFALIDSNEQVVWQTTSTQPEASRTISIGQSSDGCFYGCAIDWSKDNADDPDIYVFKTTIDGVIKSGIGDIHKYKLKAQVIPNPSQGLFTITGEFKEAQISLSNLMGQKVLQSQNILPGSKLDASALENGIYLLTVTSGDANYIQKVSIAR